MSTVRGRRIPAIHKQIAQVLSASAILLSLTFGVAIFLYETWRAVERFEEMAVVAAGDIAARLEGKDPLRMEPLDDTSLASFLAERYQVPGGHFVAVQVSDDTGRVVASAVAHGFSALPEHHSHPATTTEHLPPYKEILVQDGELFVLVVREMVGVGKTGSGRFQGMFHIEAEPRNHVIGAAMEAVVLTALAVLLTTAALYPIMTRLHRDLVVRSDELMHSHVQILQALGNAIAKRDSDTHVHNFRVTFYAVRLAEEAGRTPGEIASLIKGAFLHDLGKIAISDAILLKPGRLTDGEMTIMRTHVVHGLEMVAHVPWLSDARDVVGSHHEWWNGAGYPSGLRGDGIPINARIFAIADVFDALTSRRPYKAPLPLAQVMDMLRAEQGTHFDPHLLEMFLPMAAPLFEVASDEARMTATVFQLANTYLEA